MPAFIRAISIRQPFAWAVVTGLKTIENRSLRFPRLLGPVLIHAGLTFARDVPDELFPDGHPELDGGGFVGIANIVGHVTDSDDPWFGGPLGLVMADARPLPFMPWKGQVGLFKVSVGALADWGREAGVSLAT